MLEHVTNCGPLDVSRHPVRAPEAALLVCIATELQPDRAQDTQGLMGD